MVEINFLKGFQNIGNYSHELNFFLLSLNEKCDRWESLKIKKLVLEKFQSSGT